ncbi:MAG: signal peptidase I, partial [Clostridia bacterium]|nr:signal peptidase I [Clostridia bacterium]
MAEQKDIDKNGKKTALKVLRWVGFILLLVLTITLTVNALLCVFVKHYYPTFGQYRLFAIVSDSMEPEIPTGDMIVGRVPESESDIEIGTVITYELPQGNGIVLITHRVIDINTDAQGVTRYTTRGDNAEGTDAYRPTFDQVVGIYTGNKCGFFGYLFGFLQSSAGAITLIIILLIIALTWIIIYFVNLVQVWRNVALNALQKSRGILSETRIAELGTIADVIGIAIKDPETKAELKNKDKKLDMFMRTSMLPGRPYRNEVDDDFAFLNSADATETILRLVKVSQEGGDAIAQNTAPPAQIVEKPVGPEVPVAAVENTGEPYVPYEEIITERFERMGYVYTYSAKLIQLKNEAKEWYSLIKNELLSYKKVRSRISNRCESFMYGRKTVAKFTVRGRTLCLSLATDPTQYEGSKFSVEQGSKNTPCMYRIRSARRSRYALLLIADLFAQLGAEKDGGYIAEDFYLPYEGTVALMERGLVKRKLTSTNRKFKIIEIIDDEEVELTVEKSLPFEKPAAVEEYEEEVSAQVAPVAVEESAAAEDEEDVEKQQQPAQSEVEQTVEEQPLPEVEQVVEPEIVEEPVEEVLQPEVIEEP